MSASKKGILHQYTHHLSAFEYTPDVSSSPQNLLIFIGGLFDGLGTVPYSGLIADHLTSTWSMAQIILSSSYKGWGVSSLQKDVVEISKCVDYFRRIKKGLIVLMGHSTGCQDVMEYLTGSGHEIRPPIDGAILQAPVSDREFISMSLDHQVYTQSCLDAQAVVDAGMGDQILPYYKEIQKILPCPISAKRWLSLASPNKNGDDDYFSSDLTTSQLIETFGKLPEKTPICILISGADQYIPPNVDKKALLGRWASAISKGEGKYSLENSGIIEAATHNLSSNDRHVVNELMRRILGFLGSLRPYVEIL